MDDRTAQMCELMRFESNRLRSFQMNPPWPKDYIDIKKLAKAGFFYVFSGDNVLCAFCRGQVCRWERDDDPMTEHARHFTTCPFIMGGDVGNVPLGEDPLPGPKRPRAYDVCGPYPNFPLDDPRSLEERYLSTYSLPADEQTTNNNNSTTQNGANADTPYQSNYSSNNGNLGQDIQNPIQLTSQNDHPIIAEEVQSQQTYQVPACEDDTRSSILSTTSSTSSSSSTYITSSVTQAPTMPSTTETSTNSQIRQDSTSPNREPYTMESFANQFSNISEPPSQSNNMSGICKICYTNSIELAFLPCGHTVSCLSCAQRLYNCPCCRVTISSRIRLYFG